MSVARGYMRNYLQPRRLAEPASAAIVDELRRRDAERARHEARTARAGEDDRRDADEDCPPVRGQGRPAGRPLRLDHARPTSQTSSGASARSGSTAGRSSLRIRSSGSAATPSRSRSSRTSRSRSRPSSSPKVETSTPSGPRRTPGRGVGAERRHRGRRRGRGGHGHERGDRNRGAGRRPVGRPEPARARPLAGTPVVRSRWVASPPGGGRQRAAERRAPAARDARHCP